jgi:hypothetical protein
VLLTPREPDANPPISTQGLRITVDLLWVAAPLTTTTCASTTAVSQQLFPDCSLSILAPSHLARLSSRSIQSSFSHVFSCPPRGSQCTLILLISRCLLLPDVIHYDSIAFTFAPDLVPAQSSPASRSFWIYSHSSPVCSASSTVCKRESRDCSRLTLLLLPTHPSSASS